MENAGDLERSELEQRGREVAHVRRAADLVLVEHDISPLGERLLRAGLAVQQRRADDEPVGEKALRLELRAAVLRDGPGLVLLPIGGVLAVEDEVGGDVNRSRARTAGRLGRVARAAHDHVRVRLDVGGMDHHVDLGQLERSP